MPTIKTTTTTTNTTTADTQPAPQDAIALRKAALGACLAARKHELLAQAA